MSRSAALEVGWNSPRWDGIARAYQAEEVGRMRGTTGAEHSLAHAGAENLWRLLHQEEYVPARRVLTADQAVEMAKAGVKAIYLNGSHVSDEDSVGSMVPIIVDTQAGLGGVFNAFALTKSLIENSAAGVCFGDLLSSARKSGHIRGRVLVPTRETIHKLIAARLAADILDVPTVLIAGTGAIGAQFITSDSDADDSPFLTGERTIEGFFAVRGGIDAAIARGLAYAPYADMLWFETSALNLAEAGKFARAIHAEFPGKLLACNCSLPSHWKSELNDWEISRFQRELAAMGYRFQLHTPTGFQALSPSPAEFAHPYAHSGQAGQLVAATA